MENHVIYIAASKIRLLVRCVGLVALIVLSGCEGFLEVDLNKTKIDLKNVFSDDVTATSAVTGMYVNIIFPNAFASGEKGSIWGIAGASADELYVESSGASATLKQFETNNILPDNPHILNSWNSMYWVIYQANSILEGLETSVGVTPSVKRQLQGEAYFIRAFSHFYLTNLFGKIPLVITTDYSINSSIGRSDLVDIYQQIEDDLRLAKELLSTAYATSERIRPNKGAATALLSRVLLYREKWNEAIEEANEVISNIQYQISEDLNSVFLANSIEAIWQLKPNTPGLNTWEAYYTHLIFGPPDGFQSFSLNESLYEAFEPDDLRFSNWIRSASYGGNTYFYPYKFKVTYGSPVTEYMLVMRLAEIYLVRAEARANNGDLNAAIHDVDIIRNRAGLPLILDTNPGISQSDLLMAIEQERKVELFVEWGHRWLDLKRTNRADIVLAPMKNGWQPTDVLYPLPQSELDKNPNLGGNNQGY